MSRMTEVRTVVVVMAAAPSGALSVTVYEDVAAAASGLMGMMGQTDVIAKAEMMGMIRRTPQMGPLRLEQGGGGSVFVVRAEQPIHALRPDTDPPRSLAVIHDEYVTLTNDVMERQGRLARELDKRGPASGREQELLDMLCSETLAIKDDWRRAHRLAKEMSAAWGRENRFKKTGIVGVENMVKVQLPN